jgi:RecB family exonuclease
VKLLAHASPAVLEAELLDRVAAAKASDPLAPVLIVVTSRRLAEHVMGRLVERFGAVLGVLVLHHRALAARILEEAGALRLRALPDALTDTLFSNVVQRASAGPLRDFVREHPGAAAALRITLTDLRDAGIDPKAAAAALSGPEAETAGLYARWSDALDELARHHGLSDDAGLVRAATLEATAFAARFSAIFHHGAYDLIGVRSELVRALDAGREVAFLLPADSADATGAFGVQRASAIAALSAPTPLERELPAPSVGFFHAQGEGAELKTAVYEALAAVAAGTPPQEVALVVRAFGPYAAALDAVFDRPGAGWRTSYTQPLRRDPGVAAALRAMAAGLDRGPRRWDEHADDFAAIASDTAAAGALAGIWESMRGIAGVLDDDRKVSRAEAIAWLDARVDATSVAPKRSAPGGVQILDAMQARGLTFDHLGLAGMNAGLFPRVARPDPFLSDGSRARLREATGRPLPIAAESAGEERLLLAMLLRSARARVLVSWRRADEAARPQVPSLALGAIARFADQGTDVADLEHVARAIPAHPRSRLAAWARLPGLLDPLDELMLAALAAETGAKAGPAVAARRPELASGVALVDATESFVPLPGPFDARVGVNALRGPVAATALERLGRCPLQFFFRHVLHVVPNKVPDLFAPDAADIGLRIHDVLRRVYARLRDEGAFDGGDTPGRVTRAREILRDAWSAGLLEDAEERAHRLPVLARIETDRWLGALDVFLEADLRRLAATGLVPEALELDVEQTIPGGPQDVAIRARFDRVLRGADGRVVSDYKTGGNLKEKAKIGEMLSGEALQVPIYALIANAPVELLGVGVDHDPVDDVVLFKDFKSGEQRDGVLETLRVAVALAQSGRFPIHPGDHCDWCDFRSACRRGHPPTEDRELHAADIRDARDCWSKSAKAPTMAAVREKAGS